MSNGEVRERRCGWSDLYISQCAHCTGDLAKSEAVERPDASEIGAMMVAQYRGRCGYCSGIIDKGELLARDTEGVYVCERCIP